MYIGLKRYCAVHHSSWPSGKVHMLWVVVSMYIITGGKVGTKLLVHLSMHTVICLANYLLATDSLGQNSDCITKTQLLHNPYRASTHVLILTQYRKKPRQNKQLFEHTEPTGYNE